MGDAAPSSTYVTFQFYKLDGAFRRLPAAERLAAVAELKGLLTTERSFDVRPYSTLGLRESCDLLLWIITKELAAVPDFTAALYRTRMGAHLTLAHSYTATTKPTPYTAYHPQHFEAGPATNAWLVVYPFTKTHAWYQMPFEQRKAMMDEHRKVGAGFERVLLNTTYEFGLGDYDFMLAFEFDDPREFSDLVQKLRETKGRVYTEKDTPFFVCRRQPVDEMLRAVAGL